MSTELRPSEADARNERAETARSATEFDPDARYELNPNVALRPESFGALAYHFGTRRLSFLKTPTLVTIVRALSENTSVRDALVAHGVPERQREGYLSALASLARADMIVRS
ncbi:mycofactocin biosynthesis chaperone MftB [Parasphingorhabdus pacifica]